MPSPSLYRCTSKSTVLGFTFILRYISLSRLYTFSLSFSDIQFPFIRNFSLDKTREGFVISKPVRGDCFFLSLSLSFFSFFFLSPHILLREIAFLLLPLARVFSPLTRRVIFLSQERKKERRERKRESETIGYSRGYSNDASLRREKKAEKTRRRVFKHGRVWNVLERRRDF